MSFEHERAVRAANSISTNIARILEWTGKRTLDELRDETLVRYAIERAFITIDGALRDVPAALIAKHALPVRVVADFRNVLAHSYENVLDIRIVSTIKDDLPLLDAQVAAILTDLETAT